MTSDLQSQIERYTSAVVNEQAPTTPSAVQTLVGSVRPVPEPASLEAPPPRRRVLVVIASAAAVLLLIGGVAALSRFSEPPSTEEAAPAIEEEAPAAVEEAPKIEEEAPAAFDGSPVQNVTQGADVAGDGREYEVDDGSGSAATGGSPLPDADGGVSGDDGSAALPLGAVAGLPNTVQLDFLFEFCWGANGECFRDGHFMDPANPGVGSGPFTSDEPFHVRHGFINNGDEPLGDGFDVVIYVTALDEPGEFGGEPVAETIQYTSDYVVRGTSEQCGPTYGSQEGPETCEWFVHEFNDGLPEGRHALWAEWEAPCSAWIDYGFTDSCTDPTEVMSLFSSGFDSPFGPFPPSYSEYNEAFLTDEEIAARRDMEQQFHGDDDGGGTGYELVVDDSGAAATGGSPAPAFGAASAGDEGSAPLPLGTVSGAPDSVHLDFLFELCWGPNGECFRDGHFMDPANPTQGSGPFTSDEPFHVRHGFINSGDDPLGDGFDVVIYVIAVDAPGESGGEATGTTLRYTSDYVVRGTSEQCGPTYGSQDGPETCEWFVHEFNDGLPEGRHALWAVWEAPCSAWVDYGFTDSCADPDEVMSLFSSGFDSPFGPFPPSYTERSEGP